MKFFLLFLLYDYKKEIVLFYPIDSFYEKIKKLLKSESKINNLKILKESFQFEYEAMARRYWFDIIIQDISKDRYTIRIKLNILQRIFFIFINCLIFTGFLFLLFSNKIGEKWILLLFFLSYFVIQYLFILYKINFYEEKISGLIIDLQDEY